MARSSICVVLAITDLVYMTSILVMEYFTYFTGKFEIPCDHLVLFTRSRTLLYHGDPGILQWFPFQPIRIQTCKHIVNILYRKAYAGVPCPLPIPPPIAAPARIWIYIHKQHSNPNTIDIFNENVFTHVYIPNRSRNKLPISMPGSSWSLLLISSYDMTGRHFFLVPPLHA